MCRHRGDDRFVIGSKRMRWVRAAQRGGGGHARERVRHGRAHGLTTPPATTPRTDSAPD
jgi:hypothetical protein